MRGGPENDAVGAACGPVRTALSAFGRVWPLSATGIALAGTGIEVAPRSRIWQSTPLPAAVSNRNASRFPSSFRASKCFLP
jgi:hypothetical protein